MKMGYSPSITPSSVSWRAATPNQPAPKVGYPGIVTDVMVRRTSGSAAGDSGLGSTAAMASGSVSQMAVTAVDQISAAVASSSRLRWTVFAP